MNALGYEAERGHSHTSIEGLASRIRRIVGVGPVEAFPARQCFEDLHRFEWGLPVAVVPHVEEIASEGLTRYRPSKNRIEVVLAEARTYADLERGDPRAAFTFVHELLHALEHSALLMRMNVIPHEERALMRAVATHPKYLDTEWQANAGAGALLVPAAGLVRLEATHGSNLTPTLVANAFGCSVAAASVRLKVFRDRRRDLV